MNTRIKQSIEAGGWFVCTQPRKFPCNASGDCPHEYGPQNPERNIEGMPLIDGDMRSCPTYGHLCPVFMEELGLGPEDLEIRATLHCGLLLKRLKRMRDTTENVDQILARYEETLAKYPETDYPEYYV